MGTMLTIAQPAKGECQYGMPARVAPVAFPSMRFETVRPGLRIDAAGWQCGHGGWTDEWSIRDRKIHVLKVRGDFAASIGSDEIAALVYGEAKAMKVPGRRMLQRPSVMAVLEGFEVPVIVEVSDSGAFEAFAVDIGWVNVGPCFQAKWESVETIHRGGGIWLSPAANYLGILKRLGEEACAQAVAADFLSVPVHKFEKAPFAGAHDPRLPSNGLRMRIGGEADLRAAVAAARSIHHSPSLARPFNLRLFDAYGPAAKDAFVGELTSRFGEELGHELLGRVYDRFAPHGLLWKRQDGIEEMGQVKAKRVGCIWREHFHSERLVLPFGEAPPPTAHERLEARDLIESLTNPPEDTNLNSAARL